MTYVISTIYFFFFFNDTATTEIYTLSLHDALPISLPAVEALSVVHVLGDLQVVAGHALVEDRRRLPPGGHVGDRKSTRLNSSHANISYAVFCLKKQKKKHANKTDYCLHLTKKL